MLGVAEIAVVGLVVLVTALVLRLRQYEPAAVERLGRRLDGAHTELADVESRVAVLREELAQGEELLTPLHARRSALEVELQATDRALVEQRSRLAEVESALRDAQVRLATTTGAAESRPTRSEAVVRRAVPGRVDLGAVVASAGATGEEPPVVTTGGAVRPTEALPPQEPDGYTAGEERAP